MRCVDARYLLLPVFMYTSAHTSDTCRATVATRKHNHATVVRSLAHGVFFDLVASAVEILLEHEVHLTIQ